MLFPALNDEDLNALADNIKEHGLLHPVVLDRSGQVLDGRSRLKACEILGVEASFTTYEGDDPVGYALSVNIHRRNLTKGQIAMITAKACSLSEQSGRSPSEHTSRSLSERLGVSLGTVGKANTVLLHAPDLVDPVISGATGLNEAYSVAQDNKATANSADVQLARLRKDDPELANRVVEGSLTLAGALAERTERVDEEIRQRRVATQLLCEVLPSLAQVRGSQTFALYDPEFATPGRAVTREVIAHAATAVAEMAAVWKERDLP
ncbi:ParB N-terminal domain-containing protein [Streptomyces sp. SID13666]|uniref:ParB/RepB/Spo0J family partition protein n=1 Tax=unclassified Streptomyces TaxID=2593676 RepID=UPI0013BFB2C3|nr:ParB N-terminal domain-containing protein [Streptomyces sp. H39-C1]MCZ4101294.1 ParB N-terminal domain-containing protein [Streptomyces sp. H39-C1]NEA59341.1 ParB N-terminal domain-containing protein [Streptomyces sp. SID13666]